jgi:ribosomal-protein-serine acetyltransferase
VTGPAPPVTLDGGIVLRPLTQGDAAAMHAVVVANRAHFDRWLRWSSALSAPDDVAGFLAGFEARAAQGDGWHYGIWADQALAGGVVCWYIHRQNRNAEVGYWLSRDQMGHGLATRAARWAVTRLFTGDGLNRVELQCGVGNRASRAVAERLGFTLEGIRRESHWITDRFVDHAVYGMLRREWEADGDG